MMGISYPNYSTCRLIDDAIGALKLYQLHLDHPTAVAAQAAKHTGADALQGLGLINRQAIELAEAHRLAAATQPAGVSVAVQPTEHGFAAYIIDAGEVVQLVTAKTPAGLAELLRMGSKAVAA